MIKLVKLLNQGADWILLKSINRMVHEYDGFFMDARDPLGGNQIPYGTKQWKKLYKKLSPKDRKTVDQLNKQNHYNRMREAKMTQSSKLTNPAQQLEYIKAYAAFGYISTNRAYQRIQQAERLFKTKQYGELDNLYKDVYSRVKG